MELEYRGQPISRASAATKMPPIINRLALKIGGSTGLVGGLGMLFVPTLPNWVAATAGVGLAAVGYAIGHLLLHRRLARLRTTLQQIREHDFEDLPASPTPRGDELDDLLREAHRAGHSLENEIRELKERESYRREFIGNVSHELKTPIFSVQGFAETLLDGALNDETVNRTFLKKILHNVNRLDNLARDLSTITKIETDELQMSNDVFEVEQVFEATMESVEVKAEENHVTLRRNIEPDLPALRGDKDRIRRVLVNLVDNAIKYNDDGGTVTLCAQPAEEGVQISVIDDGIGIPDDHLPRLTERFYRVDKSRSRNQGGTGLGLAIVKHILKAHDTSLHVESSVGEGSTFSFTLTAARTASPQPAV